MLDSSVILMILWSSYTLDGQNSIFRNDIRTYYHILNGPSLHLTSRKTVKEALRLVTLTCDRSVTFSVSSVLRPGYKYLNPLSLAQ